jgi:hypothetical protein
MPATPLSAESQRGAMRAVSGTLALFLLAGCAGSSADDPEDAGGDGPLGSDASGNSTTPRINLRPLPTLDASVVQGAPPLTVDFALGGADPDDDPLNWTLDLQGDAAPDHNGTALPANVTHVFETAGSFNVTFTLSDGLAEARSQITINVTGDAVPTEIPEPIVFTGYFGFGDGEANLQVPLAAKVGSITFHMEYNQEVGGVPEVDNDLDWEVTGPGGQGGEGANYGPEDDIVEEEPNIGEWNIRLIPYSIFPTGCDYAITVTFA